MEANTQSIIAGIPDRCNIIWKFIKRLWWLVLTPILVGAIFLQIGWTHSNPYFLNIGVIALCTNIFIIFCVFLFAIQDAEKNFIKSVAKALGYTYTEHGLVLGLGSIFLNIGKEIHNYTAEEAKNVIGGIYQDLQITLYQYKMGTIGYPNYRITVAGGQSIFDFLVLEIKIEHSIPNIICMPRKGFAWPSKYRKNSMQDFDVNLQKYYRFYSTAVLDEKSKEVVIKITRFILTKDTRIGIEFCEGRVIIFQYGKKVNKKKVGNFFEVAGFSILNI